VKLISLTILTVLVSSLIGCTSEKKADSQPAPDSTRGSEILIPVSQQAGLIASEAIRPTNIPDLLRVPGKIILPDNGNWRVGAIAAGRIERVFVSQGDYVRQGQVLARMHSHDVHEAKADYLTALSERSRLQSGEAVAQKNYERTQRLYTLKAASLEQTELAHQQWVDAQAAVRNSDIAVERERVHLEDTLGISASNDQKEGAKDLIPVRAPASGYVLEKNATPGAVVEPSADLFVIGELERLWMITSVREEYLGKLRTGQKSTITVNGVPGLRGEGRVTNVGEKFDPTTHVMQVRIEFNNPGKRFRPEMLAEAEIPIGVAKPMLLVPSDSVQQIDGQDVVFVRTGDDRFSMRPVRTAQPIGTQTPIVEGLKPGEPVVVRGSFILKSELLKSEMKGE
jgi:membrane fusion protein, heavy metal efflux system